MAEKHSTGIVICLVAIMVMSVGGCKSKSEPPAEVSDIDILQGTWVGTELGNNEGQWTFIISGTKIDMKGPEPEAYSGTLELNTEVEPKQADFVIEKCAIERYVGTTALGIYKIEGDKFMMASNEPGSAVRPSLFERGGGTRVFTFTKRSEGMQAKQQELQKTKGPKNIAEGKAFLEKNKNNEGVKELPSGLQYKIIKKGTGETPTANSKVKTHYRGTLVNGTEFDSSYKRNAPVEFPVNGVIKGWTEALQLMKVGAKWELYIPANLAYGERGRPSIPANSTLIFEIELLEIVK